MQKKGGDVGNEAILAPIDLAETVELLGNNWEITQVSLERKWDIPRVIRSTVEWFKTVTTGKNVAKEVMESHRIILEPQAVSNWLLFLKISEALHKDDANIFLASVIRGFSKLIDPEVNIQPEDPHAAKDFAFMSEQLIFGIRHFDHD